MDIKRNHVAGAIEAVIGVINIALVEVAAIAVIGIEGHQIVSGPIGELMFIRHRPNR